MKKRICLDARFYASTHAGLSRYTKALIDHLMPLDHDTQYTVILRPEAIDEFPKTMPSNWKIEVLDIVHYSLNEQTVFLRYLNKQQFDLVYFIMFNHPIAYRGKSVVMIHDLIMHMYPPRPAWHPRTWVYRFVMWHAARWSKAIITNSHTTTNDVVKFLGVPKSKCHTIHLAVEEEFRPANESELAKIAEKYHLNKPYILFLNSWRPHKGLPELLEAFGHLRRHDIELVIGGKPNAGFPEIKTAVESAQKNNPQIKTLGFIDDADLPALYSGSKCYVNPSHYEGFGFGLLEAMACGAPVLAADNACLQEVGGDAALYFKTKSPTDLVQKMGTLLDGRDLRADLIKKGLERVKDFSFARMAGQTLDVFTKVLEGE